MKKKSIVSILLICLSVLSFIMFSISSIGYAESLPDIQTEEILNISFNRPISTFSITSNDYIESSVTTPMNTSVSVLIYSYDLTSAQKTACDNTVQNIFPNAVKIADATLRYNCHSYAWYSQNTTTNDKWMPLPTAYYTDGSFYEADNVQVGDRICYFNAAGTPVHSGIVVGVLGGTPNGICGDANLYTVESKWGPYGLYNHRGDQCPYPFEEHCKEPSDIAISVKYYRKAHVHFYRYTWVNLTTHTATCRGCGDTYTGGHVIDGSTPGEQYATCLLCRGNADIGFVRPYGHQLPSTANGSYIAPNGITVLNPLDFESYFNGTLVFATGNVAMA